MKDEGVEEIKDISESEEVSCSPKNSTMEIAGTNPTSWERAWGKGRGRGRGRGKNGKGELDQLKFRIPMRNKPPNKEKRSQV